VTPPYPIVLPTPFAEGPVNVYFFPGDPPTLFDVGPKGDQVYQALTAGLSQFGARPADLKQIVISHGHVDHFGLAATLVRESGARVLTHLRNQPILEQYVDDWRWRRVFFMEIFQLAGVPDAIGQVISNNWDRFIPFGEGVALNGCSLQDGATLMLSGEPWQVLHTPGHASGLICLYQPDRRLLLSSDHLLRDITSNPFLEPPRFGETERPRSLLQYLDSLQRVAALDVAMTYTAHGEPILDLHAHVAQIIAFHQERKERLADLLRSGPQTIYDLVVGHFGRLSPFDTFLAVSEVVGHLDWLEVEGRVVAEKANGRLIYQLV